MVLLIREKRILDDGTERTEIEYRGFGHPTPEQIEKAELLDKYLSNTMIEISNRMEKMGLLSSTRGNRDRWYHLGKSIAEFIDNPEIIPIEIKRQDYFIWIAIEQNSPEILHPNKEILDRKNTNTKRNHFRLCYHLSKFPFDVVKLHTWREWVEIMESPAILNDDRILSWLSDRMLDDPTIKLRILARAMRRQLKDMYTNILDENELCKLLDQVYPKSGGANRIEE